MKISLVVLACIFTALTTATAFGQDKKTQGDSQGFGIKELKAFHDVLHPLVHDALPKGDYSRIKESLDKLLVKAKAIQKAKLPKALAARKKEFQKSASELVRQLTDMNTMKNKVDDETFDKAFNEMHDTFEQLAEIAH